MLRKILAITGKSGLYEILSQGNKTLIVQDLATKKRMPIHPRDKVVSLGDITIYTESGDMPLGEILTKLYEYKKGEQIDVKGLMAEGKLRSVFEEVIPDFDKERVYDNDIKKLFTWYNILRQGGYETFVNEETEETPAEEPAE